MIRFMTFILFTYPSVIPFDTLYLMEFITAVKS